MEEEAEAIHANDGDSGEDDEADEAEARFDTLARKRVPPSSQTRREQAAAQVRAIVNHGFAHTSPSRSALSCVSCW